MGALRRNVVLIDSKGCSKLFPVLHSPPPPLMSQPNGPFSSLVICVTGLSKDARKQVKEATERLGGEYSPHLHLRCTHLVHTLKHGARNGLFLVTIAWFVDSVARNIRMGESLYNVKQFGKSSEKVDELSQVESICPPQQALHFGTSTHVSSSGTVADTSEGMMTLAVHSVYIDSDISVDLRAKVLKFAGDQGAKVIDSWFVGCNASLVVCEGASVQRYLGHANTIVTPLWVLKTAERHQQRLVHMPPDLARQLVVMLDNLEDGAPKVVDFITLGQADSLDAPKLRSKSKQERNETVNIAKTGVRRRRARHMQTCQNPIRRITQNSLLENICWTVSEAASTATIFYDSCSSSGCDITEPWPYPVEEGKDKELASFSNSTRPLMESEKREVTFKDSFLTILYPADRFSEMGPSSRTYFSDTGFTCLQILDYIHRFYQEDLPDLEIEVVIHTDSRHADRLRSVNCNKEASDDGYGFPKNRVTRKQEKFRNS
ncbi:hypothetical protein Bca52824_035273 [Brassica carinata]|uniref:BRCT domain-containing protein n=1 Tax=Brassica carinata TaxID=52824 RepID=A0A8X7V2J8_BRACI|nr:hypothetical protein Bca52824_035273 [Brassica carinata]